MGLQGWELPEPDCGPGIVRRHVSHRGNIYSTLKEATKKHITAIIAMQLLLHTHLNRVGLAPQARIGPMGGRPHSPRLSGL